MRKLCMLFLLIIGTGLAPAAQISYDFTIPASGNPASVDFTNTASIPLFDPLLGTLMSIQVDLEGTISGTQFVDNEDPNPIVDGTGATSVEMTLSNATAGQLIMVTPVASFVFSVGADNEGNPNFVGPDFTSNEFSNVTDIANTIISDATVLAIFTGNGNIQLDLSALGSFQVTPGGNVATLTFTEGLARGTVTYIYDDAAAPEIPEPLTSLLIGGGLAVIGLLRRRVSSGRAA